MPTCARNNRSQERRLENKHKGILKNMVITSQKRSSQTGKFKQKGSASYKERYLLRWELLNFYILPTHFSKENYCYIIHLVGELSSNFKLLVTCGEVWGAPVMLDRISISWDLFESFCFQIQCCIDFIINQQQRISYLLLFGITEPVENISLFPFCGCAYQPFYIFPGAP